MGSLNCRGHEVLNPEPMALPAGVSKPETLAETIRRLVRNEISQQASAGGQETFEEADDFTIEDEDGFDPKSPWELDFDQEQYRDTTGRGASAGANANGGNPAKPVGSDGKPTSGSGEVASQAQGQDQHPNADRSPAA